MSRDSKSGQRRSQGQGGHPMMIGVFIGVLSGLCVALGVALYLNKAPSPFVSKEKPADMTKPGSQSTKTPLKFEPVKPDSEKAPSQAAVQPQAGKPPEPKPKLDFYTILPGKEEAIPEKQQPGRGTSAGTSTRVVYYLQAGAFQKATDADNLKARLALAGLEAQIQTATLPDSTVWHRVRLGPYSNTQDLDKARATLHENKIDNKVIKENEPLAKR